ncbi:MAG: hypothetical protein RSA59_02885 [Raoultibacter sp.]
MTNLSDLSTPCFVFDDKQLRDNFLDFIDALKTRWSNKSVVAYSVKTNPLAWILETAHATGCWAEVVSDEEYDWARTCGFTPRQIVFNGPIKGKDHFFAALVEGSVVNIDSERELAWLEEYARTDNPPARVGIRVNIDLESFCPGETVTGATGGRFGFCYENGEFDRVLFRVQALGFPVQLAGLHLHVTTRSRSSEVYRVLAAHAARIVGDNALTLAYIDIGGGFFGGGPANVGAYERYVEAIAEELVEVCDPQTTALIVEPGGAVVCTPGIYVGRVLDVKDTTVDRFVVTELSRINIDHEMKKDSYVYTLLSSEGVSLSSAGGAAEASADDIPDFSAIRPSQDRQVLCGYTCMESDRLCVLHDEAQLQVGDIVVIHHAGAYSMSFTPDFFIERPPVVYVKETSGCYREVRSQRRSDLFDGGAAV